MQAATFSPSNQCLQTKPRVKHMQQQTSHLLSGTRDPKPQRHRTKATKTGHNTLSFCLMPQDQSHSQRLKHRQQLSHLSFDTKEPKPQCHGTRATKTGRNTLSFCLMPQDQSHSQTQTQAATTSPFIWCHRTKASVSQDKSHKHRQQHSPISV